MHSQIKKRYRESTVHAYVKLFLEYPNRLDQCFSTFFSTTEHLLYTKNLVEHQIINKIKESGSQLGPATKPLAGVTSRGFYRKAFY